MKNLFLSFTLVLLLSNCVASKSSREDIPQLQRYRFAQLDSLLDVEARPLAILLRTDWCKYCKSMEQTTLKAPEVVQLLNEDFYFISFDAEQRDKVFFNSHWFDYQPSGRNSGTHELALALGKKDGKLTYPAFVVLNPAYEIVFQYDAYLSAAEMNLVLEELSD